MKRFWVRVRCLTTQRPPQPGAEIKTDRWGRYRVAGIIEQPMQPDDATPEDPYVPGARMATVYLDPIVEASQ